MTATTIMMSTFAATWAGAAPSELALRTQFQSRWHTGPHDRDGLAGAFFSTGDVQFERGRLELAAAAAGWNAHESKDERTSPTTCTPSIVFVTCPSVGGFSPTVGANRSALPLQFW